MPAVQTAFPLRQDAGLPGGAAMSRYSSDTGVVETAAGIPVGAPVMRGADPRGIALYAPGGGAFLGISRQNRGGTSDVHPRYKPAGYFTGASGVFVLAEGNNAVDAVVRWNTATQRYTSAAASGTVIECTGWTFDTPTTGGGLAIIKRV